MRKVETAFKLICKYLHKGKKRHNDMYLQAILMSMKKERIFQNIMERLHEENKVRG